MLCLWLRDNALALVSWMQKESVVMNAKKRKIEAIRQQERIREMKEALGK